MKRVAMLALALALIASSANTSLAYFKPDPPPPGVIGDFVWNDLNANGVQDPGEPGLAGVTVQLKTADGSTVLATSTTDGLGTYSLSGLAAGTYVVCVDPSTLPGDMVQTYDLDGKGTPNCAAVTLAVGEGNLDVDFGYTGNAPGISLVKTGPDSACVGDTITYHFVVTNTGNTSLLGGVTVTDPMLGGVIFFKTPVPAGEANEFDVTYTVLSCAPNPLVNTATAVGCVPLGGVVTDTSTWLVEIVCQQPGLSLTKAADPNPAAPGEPVTYFYTVTNTGGVPLTDIVVTDDNGTPGLATDDFVVGTIASLAPGASQTLQATRIPPVRMCMDVNGQTIEVGTLYIELLSGGDVKVTYVQSRNVVDNTYGVNAVGYKHNFSDLVGSDKAEFVFTNGDGQKVLDFYADYITQDSSQPSGYGTKGVTGGDGKMILGLAANVLSVNTSLSDNLNLRGFSPGYTVNSPAPEANYPTWDYYDSYTVVVSGGAFGSSGFGSVAVPYVHDSPSKLGFNLITPAPCEGSVTNVATAYATAGGATITATDSATVIIQKPPVQANLTISALSFGTRDCRFKIKNLGPQAVTLTAVTITWPAQNGRLKRVKLAGATIYDQLANPPTATITTWKGTTSARTIAVGQTKELKFEFEFPVAKTGYSFHLEFDGYSVDF